MEKRLLLFLVLSLGVLVGYSTLMRIISPPPPPVAEKPEEDGKDAVDPAEPQSAVGESDPEAEPGQEPPTEGEPEPGTSAPALTQQRITIGSYAADSGHSLLVTFNSKGATVERVEITARDAAGDLLYNQLGSPRGYFGHLALTPQEDGGCLVNAVGDGTPAAVAGVRVGDVLTNANATAINQPALLDALLDATKPGDRFPFVIRRKSAEEWETLTLTATLDVRPLELISPEQLRGTETTTHPLSFGLAINQQIGQQAIEINSPKLGNWSLDLLTGNEPGVEFRYQLGAAAVERLGGTGSMELVKRYRLPKAGEVGDVPQCDMRMDIELHNASEEPLKLGYRLAGPNGLPTEGWWYSSKIHKKMFYGAGARDVLCKTKGGGWWIVGGPELYKAAKKNENVTLFDKANTDPADRTLRYVAVDTQFFTAVLSPISEEEDGATFEAATALAVSDVAQLGRGQSRLTNVCFELTSNIEPVAPSESMKHSFRLYLGPKDPIVLESYELADVIYYGWFGGISKILQWLLHSFYGLIGNYGIAILMLTVLVRGCMFPLSRVAARNAAMMQELAPEMRKITEKYKGDMEKRSKAQQDLFRKHNYNPFGGCWLMFLQLPIFLGLYRCLAVDIQLRQASLIPGIEWCSNLAGPDKLWFWQGVMPSFFSSETSMLGPYLNILPLFTVALFVVHQKLFTPPATDEQSRMQLTMMKYMTLFMGFLFFKVASGLCLYFIASSLWGIAERTLVPKPKVNLSGGPQPDKPVKNAEKAANTEAAAEKKAARKKRNKRR